VFAQPDDSPPKQSAHPDVTLDAGAIVRGPRAARRLALVFTGDQYAEGAQTILDALRARRIRASFFLTGRFLRYARFQPIVSRIRAEGHFVGPHSDAHLLYATWERPPRLLITRQQFEADLGANLRSLESHKIDPHQVRFHLPPYEHHTEEISRWTKQSGLTLVNMTSGTLSHTDYMTDDDPRFTPAESIVASILETERTDPAGLSGFLLLMHLGAGPRRTRDHLHDRLAALLDELSRRGYRFARVDELLGDPSPLAR
jgi:peptidoglycan/xylan/chitin deacetylase (PgdA/CDA1 family)